MKKIIIESVPHDSHRYETVGDWYREEDGTLRIKVSDMGNEDYEILVDPPSRGAGGEAG